MPMRHSLLMVMLLLVDTGYARTWSSATGGFQVEAEFDSVVAGVVRLRKADGAIISVPLDRLSTADQLFVKQQQPQQNPFESTPDSAPAVAAPRPVVETRPTDAIVMVAEGVGTDKDSALKDAFRNAVRQAVGALVDAETLVKNDQLIEDRVLTLSGGYIQKYGELSEKIQASLVRVTIQAHVRRQGLLASLKAANIVVKPLDGQSMFSEAITKIQNRNDGQQLLNKVVEGYPAKVIRASVVRQPNVVAAGGDTSEVSYDLRVEVDVEKYDVFQNQLVAVLDKTIDGHDQGEVFVASPKLGAFEAGALQSSFFGYRFEPALGDGARNVRLDQVLSNGELRQAQKIWWQGGFDRDSTRVVVVNTKRNRQHDRTTWKWYRVPAPLGVKLGARVTVSFVDEAQQELLRDDQTFPASCFGANLETGNGFLGARDRKNLILSPYFVTLEYGAYATAATLTRTIRAAPDELKSVKSIRCSVRPL